jgi:hypothetical protein
MATALAAPEAIQRATMPRAVTSRASGPHAPATAPEHEAQLQALASADAWPAAAAALLANLGFRLVRDPEETWHLLIALRDRPTLRHFDPESVRYYAPAPEGAACVSIDRHVGAAVACDPVRESTASRSILPALWGHVHVVDRVPVENRFLTFGGDVRVVAADPTLTIVDLRSVAPIVRCGGHSQGTDELADAIGAFFGRLIVPIDFVPGAALRVDLMPPAVLYRAFLADGLRRAAAAEHRGVERAGLGSWMAAAWRRARTDTASCDAAQRLLRDLALA